MKKLLPLVLVLCLMLCACTGSTGGNDDNSSPEATTESESVFRNPLNGTPMETEYDGRVVGVSINNVSPAMPFKGINSADVFFEMYINDYCTRGLALYSDIESVPHIGSIRSTRYNFTDIALAYDAVMCFSGGSGSVITDMENSGIDYLFVDVPVGYRDEARLDRGTSFEHTLFAQGSHLYGAIRDGGMSLTSPDKDYGMNFTNEGTPLDGTQAEMIDICFIHDGIEKLTQMKYSLTLDEYTFWQYGKEMTDDADDKPATFKNVIIMFADVENQDVYHVADLYGTGEGYFACGGKMVPVRWSHENETDPFTFTLGDGTPLKQEVGSTYIAIAPTGSRVDFYDNTESEVENNVG